MSNSLIFKVQPTESIDNVERDKPNYQVSNTYTKVREISSIILGTTGAATTLSLPSDTSLPSAAQFVQLQSDQDLSITFNNTTGVSTITMANIKYISGDYTAHSFVASNANTADANIVWSIYST